MTNGNGKGNEHETLDMITYEMMDGDNPEGVEESMPPDPPVDVRSGGELSMARANRSEAESMRQRVGSDIVEATRDLCQKLVTEAEEAAENARRLEVAATTMFADAQSQRDQATQTVSEADQYQTKAMSTAERETQDYRDKAMAATKSKCRDMIKKAQAEADRLMSQAELVREAVQEELEAQRVYTEAARMLAQSNETLAEFREKTTAGLSAITAGELGRGPSPETEAAPEMPETTAPESKPVKKGRAKAKAKAK